MCKVSGRNSFENSGKTLKFCPGARSKICRKPETTSPVSVLASFLRDTGIFVFFILGYGIFRNFGIWDIVIYFGIRVKFILGYGIYWTVYFGIWDIAYPLTKSHY